MPPATTGTTERATERCWWIAAGSESPTVVPSVIEPFREIAPVAASSASASIVFPDPERPTSATFRICSGCSGGRASEASARRSSDVPRAAAFAGTFASFAGMGPSWSASVGRPGRRHPLNMGLSIWIGHPAAI